MTYAFVDIETTGGSAASSAITEIAIVLHNGEEVEDRFTTLINPGCAIPHYITAITGITAYTVAGAPTFAEIAETVFKLLENRVFVAHNVNFDHSFLLHHLREAGYELKVKKLCTVRYARKVLPGLKSYSLGRICQATGIEIENRHRATGDVNATVKLWEHLLQLDADSIQLKEMLKGRNPHSYLPMHVPAEVIDQLPYVPGVYYFKGENGKVLYVGKAVNLKFRVRSHFTNNAAGRRRQDMIRKVFSIDYTACATETMAEVLESIEIKRLWPEFNRSQKKYEPSYGLYCFEDRAGRKKLAVEKRKKTLPALHVFTYPHEGVQLVRKLAAETGVKPELLLGYYDPEIPFPENLNESVMEVVAKLTKYLPTFLYSEKGSDMFGLPQTVYFLVEAGQFKGMISCAPLPDANFFSLKEKMISYPENEFIRNLLFSRSAAHPEALIYPEETEAI